VLSLGCRVLGLGLRVLGLGFRVKGLGFTFPEPLLSHAAAPRLFEGGLGFGMKIRG